MVRSVVIGAMMVALAAGSATAQEARDDVVRLMGAGMALTTFCPDLRYNDGAFETLEAIYGIDIADDDDGNAVRAARKAVGAALEDGRRPETVCPMARAWFGPDGAVLPGLLIDK